MQGGLFACFGGCVQESARASRGGVRLRAGGSYRRFTASWLGGSVKHLHIASGGALNLDRGRGSLPTGLRREWT